MSVVKNLDVERKFSVIIKSDEFVIAIPFHEFGEKLKPIVFQELGVTVLPPGTEVVWGFTYDRHPLDVDSIITGIEAKVTIPQGEPKFIKE